MKREVELERRLRSLKALGEAVGAMKSLSAHHFRDARRVLEPARAYRQSVERIAGWVGASLPAGDGPTGLLIIGAELGLCGSYNARLVDAAAERRAELGEGPTLCVGRRAAAMLGRREVEPHKVYEGPTSARGITGLLLELAEDVLTRYADERLSCFEIISSRFDGVGNTPPTRTRLLPIEAEEGGEGGEAPRARYVGRASFGSAVVREFLYITLFDLLLDGLASEHGARLAATEAAERWLDERSEHLHRRLMATRREASTQEMIEIVSGARARASRS